MPKKQKNLPVEQEELQETNQEIEDVETPEENDDLEENEEKEMEEPESSEEKEESESEEDLFDKEAFARAIEEENSARDQEREKYESMMRMIRAQNLFESAKDARRNYDREWLSRDLFRRGYQFSSQNAQTGAVSIRSMSHARVPVNLTWAYIRSIKNQVTSFNPKWEVLPEFKGKRSEQNARMSGKLLDYLFVKNNMNKKIKEAVIQGLIYSVGGPFEVVWNPHFDNGPHQPKGEVEVILHDPYDIYIDPNAIELSDANFIVKAVLTSVDEVRNNPNYIKSVRMTLEGGTSKLAESEYKQLLMQAVQSNGGKSDENETVILKEIQMKERDRDGQIKIRFLTWVDELAEPLRDELVDQEDYDMEIFQADMNPLELYGDSWSKHVIALNRVVNHLESSVFDYNYRYAKGRIVIDKNSGIRSINNEHGSIIEKNHGAEVRPLPLQPLPSSVENQILRIKNMMEDISGVHEATLGRTPPGIKSGIGVAELKQSDATNQDDLVQNLEQCLMRLGKKILKKVAEHYDTPRIAKVVGTGRMVDHFAVVGEDYIGEDKENWKVKEEKYPLARIARSNELQVQIGSWLAYSKEAQQKTLMDLAKAGIISQEDILKYLEFPDVQDVIDRTRSQQLIELKRKEAPESPSGVSQEMLALAENEMLAEGNMMPVDPEDDHELHIAVHQHIVGQGGDDRNITTHILEHRRAQKGGGKEIPKNTLPPEGSETPPEQPPGAPMSPPPMMPPAAPPQMPPQLPPMPPQGAPMGMGAMPPSLPPAPPVASFFSGGIQELPPTAGSILGGAVNTIPTF